MITHRIPFRQAQRAYRLITDTPHDTAAAILVEVGVPIVEDACQAHGTTVRCRYAATGTAAGYISNVRRR